MKSRRRTIGLLVALAGMGGFLVSGYVMGRAVSRHYREHGRELFVFQQEESRRFEFDGRPVSIEDTIGDAGQLRVRVTYGDDSIKLTPTVEPGPAELPGLARHQDWLRVIRFAPARGMTQQEFERRLADGEIQQRMSLVVRRPPPGAEEHTYAKVWGSEWRYEFQELLPEGGFKRELLRYPTRDEDATSELEPGTWEFEAALGSWGFDPMAVMAPHASPTAQSAREAIEASGWALPGASLSLLACVIALAVAFAPSGRKRDVDAA